MDNAVWELLDPVDVCFWHLITDIVDHLLASWVLRHVHIHIVIITLIIRVDIDHFFLDDVTLNVLSLQSYDVLFYRVFLVLFLWDRRLGRLGLFRLLGTPSLEVLLLR